MWSQPVSPLKATIRISCVTTHGKKTALMFPPIANTASVTKELIRLGLAVNDKCRIMIKTSNGDYVLFKEKETLQMHLGDVTSGEILIVPQRNPVPKEQVTEAEIEFTPENIKALTAGVKTPVASSERSGITRKRELIDAHAQLFNVMGALCNVASVLQNEQRPSEPSSEQVVATSSFEELRAKIDPMSLRQLKDVGFPENRCIKAMVLNEYNAELALEWLIHHSSDADVDEPIRAPNAVVTKHGAKFVPDPGMYQRLKDMGFGENDVIAVLQLTRNSFEASCDWLLGGQNVQAALAEQQKDLEPTNPIMKALLEDAKVYAALFEPRVLQALRAMMVDAGMIAAFVPDPIVGPVLVHIYNKLGTMVEVDDVDEDVEEVEEFEDDAEDQPVQ